MEIVVTNPSASYGWWVDSRNDVSDCERCGGGRFTALKFDPVVGGYQDMGLDRLVKTARDLGAAAREGGGPDLDLIVEVHRKLTPMNGIVLAEALTPFNLYFLEDPIQIDSIVSQAELTKRMTVPLGIGERLTTIWEFRELLAAGALNMSDRMWHWQGD